MTVGQSAERSALVPEKVLVRCIVSDCDTA
jgi:hypothetical protein